MRTGTLAFLIGIVALQTLGELPATDGAWFVVALVCLWLPSLRLVAAVFAGFLWAWLFAALVLSQELSSDLEGKDLVLEGVVATLPVKRDRLTRFEFDITRMRHEGEEVESPGRVRLSWYTDAPLLHAGEVWRLTVRLKRPRGFRNPGGFDYEGWLFHQGIRATGYVRKGSENQRLSTGVFGYTLTRWRQDVANALDDLLQDAPRRGILRALAIGERKGIDADAWEVLTRTGTNHLVAISGLHIGLVATGVFFIGRWLWVLPGFTVRYVPAQKPAALAGLLAATVYAALAGFSIPTVRALVMVAVLLGTVILQRETLSSRTLALALLLIVMIDPLAVLSAGFWLSFGAVAVILYGMTGRLASRNLWWRWGRVQWLVCLGLAPLMFLLFQRTSLVAPLANLVAVPVVSLIVVPCVLVALLFLAWWPAAAHVLLMIADRVFGGLWTFLEALAELGHGQWLLPAVSAWTVGFACLGAVLLAAPRGWPARWLGAVCWLPLALARPAAPAPGDVWFTLLDVGQGLAVAVRTADHVLVYDTGPRFSATFNAGEAVVVPFLRHEGIGEVDVLMISNGDNDHSGGARSLTKALPVRRVLTGADPEALGGLPAQRCQAGQHWRWDGVDFAVLHPDADTHFTGNNRSCVLRIAAAGGTLLLPGDVEQAVEKRLVKEYGAALQAHVLIAPHHGSKTSSTEAFIEQVKPDFVLFPVGYRNRFGFPRNEITARYRAAGAQMLNTAKEGAMTFKLESQRRLVGPSRYRHAARRYWHGR